MCAHFLFRVLPAEPLGEALLGDLVTHGRSDEDLREIHKEEKHLHIMFPTLYGTAKHDGQID